MPVTLRVQRFKPQLTRTSRELEPQSISSAFLFGYNYSNFTLDNSNPAELELSVSSEQQSFPFRTISIKSYPDNSQSKTFKLFKSSFVSLNVQILTIMILIRIRFSRESRDHINALAFQLHTGNREIELTKVYHSQPTFGRTSLILCFGTKEILITQQNQVQMGVEKNKIYSTN